MQKKGFSLPGWLFAGMLAAMFNPAVGNAAAIKFGVLPYITPARLIVLHQPLIDYLIQATGQPFTMVTAPGFKPFMQRTHAGDYDLVLTAPHLGRLAEIRDGYRPVVFTANRSYAVFVVRMESGIKRIADLAGATLMLPPPRAIIHHLALSAMRRNGVDPDNVRITSATSHDNALLAAIRGVSDAAAFGYPTWARYRAPGKDALRVIGRSEEIPGFFIMANPALPDERVASIRRALLAFNDTQAGARYFARTALRGFDPPDPGVAATLDPYLKSMFGMD